MAKETKKGISPADLLWDLRDTSDLIEGTDEASKTSQAFLLWVLTAHVREDQKYGTFVGYAELSRITGMSPRTIKRAAAALEKSGLIERHPRPHHSNITHVNLNHIHKKALENRAQWKIERDNQWNTTFELPAGKETDEPGVSDVEIKSSKTVRVDADGVNRILPLVNQNFGDHKTYEIKDSDAIMRGCINDCVGIAGSAKRVEDVLLRVIADAKIRTNIEKSKNLGGYIRKCMKDWMEVDGDGDEEVEAADTTSTEPFVEVLKGAFPEHPSFKTPLAIQALREKLLVCIDQAGSPKRLMTLLGLSFSDESEIGCNPFNHVRDSKALGSCLQGYMDDLMDRYGSQLPPPPPLPVEVGEEVEQFEDPARQAAYLLSEHTGVHIQAPPPNDVSEDDLTLLQWAVNDPKWSSSFRQVGGMALDYFFGKYGKIKADREAEESGDVPF